VGARGHTGAELVKLIERHPHVQLAFASSRQGVGKPLADLVPGTRIALLVEDLSPTEIAARDVDAVVLALPNGAAKPYIDAIDASGKRIVIVDLSADHRFDDTWAYGLPEHHRDDVKGAVRIANPGCYATGAQVGTRPLLDLVREVHVFGVSGYSGAGTTPSPRNDPAALHDNLMPYALTGHLHEREISRHLQHRVYFTPHVAPFFRGITLTLSMTLTQPIDVVTLRARYRTAYDHEPLVRVVDDIPLVRDAALRHDVTVGGFAVDESGTRVVVVVTLDNLLKGAATQAVQNLNLALGLAERAGIPDSLADHVGAA
jgi:N-acetyl-gamma-glutamyl-phosphate reductase common form